MCGLVERLEQMAAAQMFAKDSATLREAAAEIMRLRTESALATMKAEGLGSSMLELMGAMGKAADARDAEIAKRRR